MCWLIQSHWHELNLDRRQTFHKLKVIPLYCTAHPLLRIIIGTSKMVAVLPTSAKRTNKGYFCRAKAFIHNNDATDRLKASWKTRKWKKCAWSRSLQWFFTSRPLSCGIIKMSWLRLWIMGAVKLVGQLYGSPTALTSQYVAWHRYCTCCSNSESGETNISGINKTHRSTRTTRGRPVFDVNTTFAAEFTFCCL